MLFHFHPRQRAHWLKSGCICPCKFHSILVVPDRQRLSLKGKTLSSPAIFLFQELGHFRSIQPFLVFRKNTWPAVPLSAASKQHVIHHLIRDRFIHGKRKQIICMVDSDVPDLLFCTWEKGKLFIYRNSTCIIDWSFFSGHEKIGQFFTVRFSHFLIRLC